MKILWMVILFTLIAGMVMAQQGGEWSFSAGVLNLEGDLGYGYDQATLYDISFLAPGSPAGRMVWSVKKIYADDSRHYQDSGYEEKYWSNVSYWLFAPSYRYETCTGRVFCPFVEAGLNLAFADEHGEGWYTDPHTGTWQHDEYHDAEIKFGWQAALGGKFKITPHQALTLGYQFLHSSRIGTGINVYDLRAGGPVVGYALSF